MRSETGFAPVPIIRRHVAVPCRTAIVCELVPSQGNESIKAINMPYISEDLVALLSVYELASSLQPLDVEMSDNISEDGTPHSMSNSHSTGRIPNCMTINGVGTPLNRTRRAPGTTNNPSVASAPPSIRASDVSYADCGRIVTDTATLSKVVKISPA
ncbi:hypothetical protein L226DRAFT_574408 [Lentinus tigrinus ALCF2SS1-7]|uniref:Uncharacterized protein n=1 Tax=Lentinus tigrinus ALCF2SS1-6 TaxID=1328759 RepID=A0A5C2SBD6_9APHY|nr:hypothetical protein L227DRAFT_611373 [Lentinus tigrinus ALCF2SS1-6]RPD70970.1 hypothetical protein L226DRAFT_574408 [Lentinus tigrinus ALCF2SS1-7]